jgi:subtilisin family serine protease
MKEFPEWKRSRFSTDHFGNPWGDVAFHGSMVACVAAGTSADGGRYDGVAPDATLISCRVPFGDFDEAYIYPIYEHLIQLVERGEIGRLVINNSWALRGSQAPQIDASNRLLAIVRKAVSLGIIVVFAAGDNNNAAEVYSDSNRCTNTIWGANSLDEVITVAAVDESGSMDRLPPGLNHWETCHRNGSRGPGQFSQTTIKPDCVAPTYGEVLWGNGYQSMTWWGTSGAAPQVSGLAALMLSANPRLTPAEVKENIRETTTDLGLPPEWAGSGLIDCEAALARSQPS